MLNLHFHKYPKPSTARLELAHNPFFCSLQITIHDILHVIYVNTALKSASTLKFRYFKISYYVVLSLAIITSRFD
jgi:hypothetical protein